MMTASRDRFRAKTLDTGSCVEWIGSHNGRYGEFRVGGKKMYAHRYAYESANGTIPAGQVVMHTCDNTLCVNPAHLVIGTQAENLNDMRQKGRNAVVPRKTHCRAGHAFTPDNTWISKRDKSQRCRECENSRRRKSNGLS